MPWPAMWNVEPHRIPRLLNCNKSKALLIAFSLFSIKWIKWRKFGCSFLALMIYIHITQSAIHLPAMAKPKDVLHLVHRFNARIVISRSLRPRPDARKTVRDTHVSDPCADSVNDRYRSNAPGRGKATKMVGALRCDPFALFEWRKNTITRQRFVYLHFHFHSLIRQHFACDCDDWCSNVYHLRSHRNGIFHKKEINININNAFSSTTKID